MRIEVFSDKSIRFPLRNSTRLESSALIDRAVRYPGCLIAGRRSSSFAFHTCDGNNKTVALYARERCSILSEENPL